jgi:hyperosmotically inducible protein
MKILITLATAASLLLCTAVQADKTVGESIDDSTLQAEVKAKLLGDDFFGGMGINIETRKGVVQLGGFVDDEETAEKAGAKAGSVDGVVAVDNQLHVKEGKATVGQTVDDTVITTKVKTDLGEIGSGSSLFKVNVDTYNGVVLLTGFADSEAIKDEAGAKAEGTENVKKVINGIYVLD